MNCKCIFVNLERSTEMMDTSLHSQVPKLFKVIVHQIIWQKATIPIWISKHASSQLQSPGRGTEESAV